MISMSSEQLARDHQRRCDSCRGFSAQNLWYMRQFDLEYKVFPNLQQLVGEIPWEQELRKELGDGESA